MPQYTVIGVNLFHHGKSTIDNYSYAFKLNKNDLQSIFQELFETENIDKIDVMAYSLGGKIALNLIDWFPTKIDTVYLMAADGIKQNAWYNFVSNNALGQKLFLKIIENPKSFFQLIAALGWLKILPKRFVSFLNQNLESEKMRENVFKTWKTFADLHPNHQSIKIKIKANNIKVFSLFGKYDLVINYKVGRNFAKSIEQSENFVLLHCAHNVFKHDTTKLLHQLTQKQKG